MKQKELIKRELARTGVTVYLSDEGWISMPFKAALTRLWRKKSSGFEHNVTELGETTSEYYLFIAPYNHDITVLSDNGLLLYNGDKYEFKCKDPVSIDDEIIYYSGIVRRIREEQYDNA